MPLVAAKCTQCGANLQIDNSNEAAICPHCKTPFITEKAITNYKTYNNYKIENADVYIHDERSIETRLKNAEVFFTIHKNYEKARQLFLSVADDAPDDYRGWWGLVRLETEEFTYFGHRNSKFKSINEYANCALNVASVDIIQKIKPAWQEWVKNMNDFLIGTENQRNDLVSQLKTAENTKNRLNDTIHNLSYKIINLEYETIKKNTQIKKMKPFLIPIIGGISLILLSNGSPLGAIGLTISFVLGMIYFILKSQLKKISGDIQEVNKNKGNDLTQLNNICLFIDEAENQLKQYNKIIN